MRNSKSISNARMLHVLVWCGFVSVGLYVAVCWLSFAFQYGKDHQNRPIPLVLTLFGIATVGYFIALAVVFANRKALLNNRQMERRWWLWIVGFGLSFRVVMLPSNPIQEIDFYRYLWDGNVTANGVNPYAYCPKQMDDGVRNNNPDENIKALGAIADSSPAMKTIFERVHHRHVPTVYPPAAQFVFAASALLTPKASPLWLHLSVLKLFFLAFDLGTFFVLAALLRKLGLPRCWALAYCWCPLLLKEITNSAHLDVIAIFCTTAAVFLLVKSVQRFQGYFKDSDTNKAAGTNPVWIASAGMALLAAGILAKTYPLILLPVTALFLLAHFRWRALGALAICCTVVAVGYGIFSRFGPFAGPENTGDSALARKHNRAENNHSLTGLTTFLTKWQMNDLLFMIVHENFRYPHARKDHPFVIVPREWRSKWNIALANSGWISRQDDPAFLIALAVVGMVLFGLTAFWALRVWMRPDPERFIQAIFLTLIWGWLLSAAQNPWYLLWALPFMVFAKSRSWFLMTGFVFMYYLRFWLEYRQLGDDARVRSAWNYFDFGLVWVEYLPLFFGLAFEVWWRLRSRETKKLAGRKIQMPSIARSKTKAVSIKRSGS